MPKALAAFPGGVKSLLRDRSYTVLHEPGKARSALIDAKRSLAADPSAIARIEALARELGLEG
jgi:cytochrome c-type biogenesis protein CcmH